MYDINYILNEIEKCDKRDVIFKISLSHRSSFVYLYL